MVRDLRQERWFCTGTPVSSTNKADRHDISAILVKVALNTIALTPIFRYPPYYNTSYLRGHYT